MEFRNLATGGLFFISQISGVPQSLELNTPGIFVSGAPVLSTTSGADVLRTLRETPLSSNSEEFREIEPLGDEDLSRMMEVVLTLKKWDQKMKAVNSS